MKASLNQARPGRQMRGALSGVIISCAFLLLGCSNQTWFVKVPVHVIDATTSNSVRGAVITALCMGGTPYATNVYLTDWDGKALVAFYKGGIRPVKVERFGYETASVVLFKTNMVVKLRRTEVKGPITEAQALQIATDEARAMRIPLEQYPSATILPPSGSLNQWSVFWARDRYFGDHFSIWVSPSNGVTRFWGGE